MRASWRAIVVFAATSVALAVPALAQVPSDPAAVEHALNRLAYGPRPGDVERVQQIGLARWIDQQLNPGVPSEQDQRTALRPTFDSPQDARRWARRQLAGLSAAKIQRAVTSERQLEEVLVDFWFNHFNVFAGKGRTALYVPTYERDAIRPHVFGRFRDMLEATASSPAMLIYLDNRQSTVRGINENYARELLELHTLGVDGGFTQDDVTAVARVFTGWTIDPRTQTFRFAPRLHDTGRKVVLGRTVRGRGMDEGRQVLDMLATHPATARHIAAKLAQRFVSDEPPASLVDRAAARFRTSDGNLREVVRTIVTSPELFAPGARDSKVKTPLEFVVSALRASGADAVDGLRWAQALQQLGMPLYLCQPPTGYDDTAAVWLSAGTLVARMNMAQALGDSHFGLPDFQRR